jgi:hypothetical protein
MKITAFFLGLFVLSLCSCSKPAGEGGDSTITGTVWVENYNTLNDVYDHYELKGEFPGEDEDVYIIYGDEIGYGDKVKAGPGGRFMFEYLRKGTYRIYVQSKDTNRFSPSGIKTVEATVEITDKKQELDTGTLLIFK